jgi:cytochrome bd-type quinol oxidase subunit 2
LPATIVVAITPLVIVESVDLDITAAFTSALTLAALLPVLVTRVD